MADNKTRSDNLHDQMPALYNTRENIEWKALIESLGDVDQETLDLIESVRQQFFIKTASRPYIDRLGTANLIQRPRFIGMDDTTFREFIPVMSYSPKQVKLVMDRLLDIFFFKESTTSFISSTLSEPFNLVDGWELEYTVDASAQERIGFAAADFTNIAAATADEVVAAINRQATNSYAIAFENSITKLINIRIFTKTIGSKGSVEITGGRSNISFQFDGFNTEAGFGTGTEWTISVVGDTVTMEYTGTGDDPNIDKLSVGDTVIITRAGNVGSFVLTGVNPSDDTITYVNLFATAETFVQTTTDDVKFISPFKFNVYLKDRRAIVWEVNPGEIVIEMPASPPVVRRDRIGSMHINGIDSLVTATPSTSSLTLASVIDWPITGGQFYYIPVNDLTTYVPSDASTITHTFKTRLSNCLPTYTYTGVSGNNLTGITPALPTASAVGSIALTSTNRDGSNLLTVTTAAVHNFVVGEYAVINGTTLGAGTGLDVNGTWLITAVNSTTEFECYSFSGPSGARASTGGTVRVERIGTSESDGRVILTSAQIIEGLEGSYLWDKNSDFVLSSLTTTLTTGFQAGTIQRNIEVAANDIPNEEGRLIFDFGTEKQEGPVRYFNKPNDTTLAIDPSYVFQFTHDVGSSVTMIRRRGGIEFSGLGTEYGPYITDTSTARETLQELMLDIKSVGIFLNFIVRFPEQFYATIDVYRSGVDPG